VLCGLAMVGRGWVPRPSRRGLVRLARSSCPLLLAFALYLGAFVVMKPLAIGDQPQYELESLTLAYDQDRNLARSYTNPAFTNIAFGGPVPTFWIDAFPYTNRHKLIFVENVGLPLLLSAGVPWVKLVESQAPADTRWPWSIEIIVLASIAAQLLYRLLRRFRPKERGLTIAVWACTAFCAPLTIYASQIYPEIPELLLALIAADCLTRKPTVASGVIGASAAAAMPWLHVRFFLVSALLVLALTVRAVAHDRSLGRPTSSHVKAALPILAPFIASSAVMAIAFQAWYGSPWITAPFRLPQTRQPQTLLGAYWSITDLFLNPRTAALPFAPVGVLALGAVPLFCRRYGRWALFALLVAAVYVLTVTIEGSNIGDSAPGRYMIWLIPFGAFPLLFLLTEYRIARWAFDLLAALTAWITIALVIQPPPGVTGSITFSLLWGWTVNFWPTIVHQGLHDVPTVLAWTGGLLILAAWIYLAGVRRERSVNSGNATRTHPQRHATGQGAYPATTAAPRTSSRGIR
jgi:hypothetical protein